MRLFLFISFLIWTTVSCEGTNTTTKVKITKLIVPEITLKGHDIKISCVAEGSSEVNYSFARWKENSISDLISSSFKYNVKDGELVIRNLSFDDNGKYSCFAKAGEEKNLQDIKMFSIQVQQLTPAHANWNVHLNNAPNNELTLLGKRSHILRCSISGPSQPLNAKFNWTKDNGKIVDYGIQRFQFSTGAVLLFPRLKSSEHSGAYKCEVNAFGEVKHASIKLDVLDPPDFSEVKPVQNPRVPNSAEINCPVQTSASVFWKKDGVLITSSARTSFSEDGKTIKFTHFTKDLDGVYECSVMMLEKIFKKNITVIGHVAPSIHTPKSYDVPAIEGEDLTIYCNASGEPKPVISWYRKILYYNSNHLSSGNSLSFKVGKESYHYTYFCKAENDYGEISSELYSLTRYYRPKLGEITNCVVANPTYVVCNVSLAGIEDSEKPIQYEITVTDLDSYLSTTFKNMMDSTNTFIVIPNLNASTSYEINLRGASLNKYLSIDKFSFKVTTTDPLPPSPPFIVDVACNQGTDCVVYYGYNRDNGSPITNSTVYVYNRVAVVSETNIVEKKADLVFQTNSEVNFAQLQNLKPNSTYFVAVESINAVGVSETSEDSFKTH